MKFTAPTKPETGIKICIQSLDYGHRVSVLRVEGHPKTLTVRVALEAEGWRTTTVFVRSQVGGFDVWCPGAELEQVEAVCEEIKGAYGIN